MAAAAQLPTSLQFAVTSQSLRSSSSFAFAVVRIVLRSVQLRLVAIGKASCRSRFALSSCASGDRSTSFYARVPLKIYLWVELCNNLLRQVTTSICNTCRSYRGTQWTSAQICAKLCMSVQICASLCKSVQVQIREHTRQVWLACSLDWICFMFLLRLVIWLQLGPLFWLLLPRCALRPFFEAPLSVSLSLPYSSGSLVLCINNFAHQVVQ